MNGDRSQSRYTYCIYADAESIKSVINGEGPGSTATQDILHPKAFVKLIDYQWKEHPEPRQPDSDGSDFDDDDEEESDEGYPPIDGCTKEDVGWMKVAARVLIPRQYCILGRGNWMLGYVRPPRMQNK